jgi:hypothetical protein
MYSTTNKASKQQKYLKTIVITISHLEHLGIILVLRVPMSIVKTLTNLLTSNLYKYMDLMWGLNKNYLFFGVLP